jgi:glycosyltransferase involved in cell wall biosynthesis
MRCPTLKELWPPPPGQAGWPWTEESHGLGDTSPAGQGWPLISIITPSYNQGQFLEETIRSVLLQGYPRLEYIIMDGGSVDQSLKVIRQYQGYLSHWQTGKDAGQSDALRKGFARATGDLLGWVNSDDLLAPDALTAMAEHWLANHKPAVITGHVVHLLEGRMSGEKSLGRPQFDFHSLIRPWQLRPFQFEQLGSFFVRPVYEQAGGLDPSFYSAMDYDLYARMLRIDNRIVHLPKVLGYFRHHPRSKTTGGGSTGICHLQEHQRLMQPFSEELDERERRQLAHFYAEWAWRLDFKSLLLHHYRDSRQLARFAFGFGCRTALGALAGVIKRALKKKRGGERIETIEECRRAKQHG